MADILAGYVFHVLQMHLFEQRFKYKLHAAVQGALFEKLPKVEIACYDGPVVLRQLYLNLTKDIL